MARPSISDGRTATPVEPADALGTDVVPVGRAGGAWARVSSFLTYLLVGSGGSTTPGPLSAVPEGGGVVALDPATGAASLVDPGTLGGAAAGSSFTHTQSSASATWTVNHNLGLRPTVEVRSPGGMVVEAEVVHASPNQCVVYLSAPATGSVFCAT